MSLHAARLIAEKRISHPPADVLFSGISKGIDMKIEKILLESIKDRSGRVVDAWIEGHPDPDRKTKSDDVIVCLKSNAGGGRYEASTILHHALVDREGYFTITDGFDGAADICIPNDEILKLAGGILTAIPATMGHIRISVDFHPVDLSVPF